MSLGLRKRLRAAWDALRGHDQLADDLEVVGELLAAQQGQPEVETVSPVKLAPFGMMTVDFALDVRVDTHPVVRRLLGEGWEPMGVHHVTDTDGERWGRLYLRRLEA